jgi:hypothetical protein
MIPFRYIEFYDVPRTVAIAYKNRLFLLQSAFDEERDEYPSQYTVYALPHSAARQVSSGSWKFLEEISLKPLGEIPIENVKFDSTRRKSLDASVLDEFVGLP